MLESGKADLDAIVRDIRGRRKAIAACYERALKSNPALAGKLVVRFSIASAGTVVAVAIDEDTLGAADVAGCVRGLIARWRFRAARRSARRGQLPLRVPGRVVTTGRIEIDRERVFQRADVVEHARRVFDRLG